MNKEERFEIELTQEEVQEIIYCYEKDMKLIEQLQQENKELHNKIDEAIEYLINPPKKKWEGHSIDEVVKILKGDVND